jgi:hypothetical protein
MISNPGLRALIINTASRRGEENGSPVHLMWWCPTCKSRIPQPRWMSMRKPNQRAYHIDLSSRQDHTIERVPVFDGTLVERQDGGR